MKIVLSIVLTLFMSASLASQGRINTQDDKKIELTPGDVFEGVIRIWPYKGKKISNLKKLAGRDISPHFYIHKIKEIRLSPNNRDVLEIYSRMILKTDFGITSFMIIDILGIKIPVTIKNIKVIPLDKKLKTMNIVEQDQERVLLLSRGFGFIVVITTLIILSFILGYLFLTRASRKKCRELKKGKDDWREIFLKCKTRSDVENIYTKKINWISFYDGDELSFKKLMKVVEKNQYRREWNVLELEEAMSTIKIMAECWMEN